MSLSNLSLSIATIVVSAIAILMSFASLYLSYFKKGKLIFFPPSFTGILTMDKFADMIVLPISVSNTGTNAKNFILRLVVNGSKLFDQTFRFGPMRPFQTDQFNFTDTLKEMTQVPPFIIQPNSSYSEILGFLSPPALLNFQKNLIVDLWYKEPERDWKTVYRVDLQMWEKLRSQIIESSKVNNTSFNMIRRPESLCVDTGFNADYTMEGVETLDRD